MNKIILKTPSAPKAIGAYSQAIEINDFIFTSGQVGLDPETGELVGGGIQEQTKQILKNIHAMLLDIELDKNNIIKLTVFLIDLKQFSIVNDCFKIFFIDNKFPVRTTVEVSKLPLDALVEIECIAHR